MLNPTGFREYDARWLIDKDIDHAGMRRLGEAFGTMVHDRCVPPSVVTGHDYRSYSESMKTALIEGMVSAGCKVHDIGLSVTPMAYFAQFDLDVPAVAMVTASHNENGWTGVKMGLERPFTLGPGEMADLKSHCLGRSRPAPARRRAHRHKWHAGALHRGPDGTLAASQAAASRRRLREWNGRGIRSGSARQDRM